MFYVCMISRRWPLQDDHPKHTGILPQIRKTAISWLLETVLHSAALLMEPPRTCYIIFRKNGHCGAKQTVDLLLSDIFFLKIYKAIKGILLSLHTYIMLFIYILYIYTKSFIKHLNPTTNLQMWHRIQVVPYLLLL